jgi:hypothetical protein
MPGSDVTQPAAAAPAAGTDVDEAARRRRVRRSALLFGLIAAVFYLGFIAVMLVRGAK